MPKFPRAVVALRHRNFRLFWGGQLVSLTGTWMQGVAQSWLVLSLTNSPVWLGFVNAAATLPILVFTLAGGVVADLFDKRKTLVVAQTLLMLQAAALAYLTLTHRVQVWHIMALAAMIGTISSFEIPTRQAFAVELVGKEDLQNAISINSMVFNVTRILGPSAGGVVIAMFGAGGCFALNAVSFLAVLAALLRMRGPFPPPPRKEQPASHQMREGLAYIRGEPRMRGLVLHVAAVSVFGMPYVTLMPVIARDVLHGGPRMLGLLQASAGVGSLLAAMWIASQGAGRPRFESRSKVIWGGSFAVSLLLGLLSVSHTAWLSCVLLALIGASVVSAVVNTNTMLQTLVPDELRGRVMSVHVITFIGFAPMSALLAGTLAHWIGATHALLVHGALMLLFSSAFGYWVVPWRGAPRPEESAA